ncbi:MAG TPA: HDOD domain-containing protein [Candidatus Krumholzibacteria bacterium]|nr:HDOD domain-containing protein [Candidatus Krumholzibacteria bacterium]HPD71671.1 HDOD domain-containing protein [Candidatus Krumholzibacteria bacterium]HRY41396.1 HDOD domain-containing protein [Candidatus Krumholzibacteria bacterium]
MSVSSGATTRTYQISALARELAPQIATLPRLSRVVERFLLDAARDTATAEDIGAALDLDPVLRGWVIRQANSGFWNLARPVTSVAEACVVMGLRPVSRLVYAACTRDLLRQPLTCYRYPGEGFWLHGLVAGTAARRLADALGDASPLAPEAALLAGFLHDVGKLLLDRRLPRAGGPRHVTPAEERSVAGHDHGEYSAAVAAAWSLPAAIVEAVASHHDADPPPSARLLAVSDHLLRHWGVGIWTYPRCELAPPAQELAALAAPLGCSLPCLAHWWEGLPPVVDGLAEMLRALGHGTPPALPSGAECAPSPAAPAAPEGARRRRESARTRTRVRRRKRR